MTDSDQSPARGEDNITQPDKTELEYPQLLIEASFESLLSHSHSSAGQSVIHAPTPNMSLSESWSSLSENDLSHDDDLQSEPTDTGSLIDISTAEDVHSIDDQGEASEGDEDRYDGPEEDERSIHNTNSAALSSSYEDDMHPYPYGNSMPQDCIKLDQSIESTNAEGIVTLQASKTLTETEFRLRLGQSQQWSDSEKFKGTIKMTMSEESLQLGQRPFHILYHGPPLSPPEVKSDVLGKIGAALIASGNQPDYDEHPETPCYHIVPSEFGPGSRPSTADLIPIPVQMHISDCVVPEREVDLSLDSNIQIQIGASTSIVSRRANFEDTGLTSQWTLPDLAVIVVSQNGTTEDRNRASRVLEFCRRHSIANLCLQHGSGYSEGSSLTETSPDMLHEYREHVSQSMTAGSVGHRILVDVETFLALDSEQLNRHIEYLTALARRNAQTDKRNSDCLLQQIFDATHRTIKSCLRWVPGVSINGQQKQTVTDIWVVESRSIDASCSKQTTCSDKLPKLTKTLPNRQRISSTVHQAGVTVFLAMITTFVVYACMAAMPHLLNTSTATSPIVAARPSSISLVSSSALSVSTGTTAVATVSQTYALSGPLHVLEQQVQSWMPSHCSRRRKGSQEKSAETLVEDLKITSSVKCRQVVPAHVSPTLKVDKTFFHTTGPAFNVRVERGGAKISAKLETKSDGVAVVKIKTKESLGQLTVHLDAGRESFCVQIDLESTVSEAFASWNNALQEREFRVARRLGNEYVSLVEVRTNEPGLVQSALELQHSAVQGIGAAIEAIERSAVKHVKNQREALESAQQHVTQKSLALMYDAHEQISRSAKQAKDRANEVTEKAVGDVSRAVQVVQSSVKDLSALKWAWPNKMTKTLQEAQFRAQKLVRKPQLKRK